MLQAGDKVFVKDSAIEDIGALAWKYVQDHREACVVNVFHSGTNVSLPESEALYIVKWLDTFEGGWDCWHECPRGQGQIVTAKHLDLRFEASREVVTVPNL
jgi:hypothetical protein